MHAFGLYDNHESKLWHKKLWSKNTPAKHKHVRLQEWLEIVYWRQKGFLFYTQTNPQKRKEKQNRWPIYCQGICCLGRFILVFLFTSRSRSLSYTTRTPNIQKNKSKKPFKNKKACNHTQGGRLCTPAVGHTVFSTLPPGPKRCPSTITHRNVVTQNNNTSNKNKRRCSERVYARGGEGRGAGRGWD